MPNANFVSFSYDPILDQFIYWFDYSDSLYDGRFGFPEFSPSQPVDFSCLPVVDVVLSSRLLNFCNLNLYL